MNCTRNGNLKGSSLAKTLKYDQEVVLRLKGFLKEAENMPVVM